MKIHLAWMMSMASVKLCTWLVDRSSGTEKGPDFSQESEFLDVGNMKSMENPWKNMSCFDMSVSPRKD